MTISRFSFQKNAAEKVLSLYPDKLIANVGCNDDPAHIIVSKNSSQSSDSAAN